jgi:hypothetical protein
LSEWVNVDSMYRLEPWIDKIGKIDFRKKIEKKLKKLKKK